MDVEDVKREVSIMRHLSIAAEYYLIFCIYKVDA